MNNDVEPVLSSLLTFLTTNVPKFQTTGRRLQYWTDVTEFPALFIRHTANVDEYHNIIYSRLTVEAEIWVYSKAGADPDATPDTDLNCLVKDIRNSFAPDDPRGVFTLGGAAFWCRIDGRSDFDPGDIDSFGKAVIPVKITLP